MPMRRATWFLTAVVAAGPPAVAEELIAHWPLAADAGDVGPAGWHGAPRGGLQFTRGDDDVRAAAFDGRGASIDVAATPALALGTGDFTLALQVRLSDERDDQPGDLASCYDPRQRRGWQLTVKTNAGATFNQANARHLQFGIDQQRDGAWEDCGRPGGEGSILAFGLAVHRGALYAGVCRPGADDAGRVYRYEGGQEWVDCGAPDRSNAVMALISFQGSLYAGVGKYRTSGSGLEDSPNTQPGGRIYRYEGDRRWTDCGGLPGAVAIGAVAEFRGQLYASSLYAPAGFYRYAGGQQWVDCGTPDGKRVESLAPFDGDLYATSYDNGNVYRYDGERWEDCGRVGENTQCYAFATYEGRLCVSTWPSGRVYRLAEPGRWEDMGRLGEELESMGLVVHNGRLLGGTLPLAEVYQYEADGAWKKMARLDHTPDVKYRRAWTVAEHRGRSFWSALPSGRVWSFAAGCTASWDEEFPDGWHQVHAVRRGTRLELWVDGRQVAESVAFPPRDYDLGAAAPLRIGAGPNASLHGRLRDVKLFRGALPPEQIRTAAAAPPTDAEGAGR